jgi:hypothetical protein
MQKPELLFKVTPSGDPILRGYCSACRNVTFVFAGNTEESLQVMQRAFDIHLEEMDHGGDQGAAELSA